MGTKSRRRRIFAGTPSWVEVERDEGRHSSPVDALFTSTQRHVLAPLFGQPQRAFHLSELLATTGAGHGAVQRAVRKLVRAGLVRADKRGNRIYLQANESSPIHRELVALIGKTIGLAEPLRQAFTLAAPYARVCFAVESEDRGLALLFAGGRPVPHEVLEHGRHGAEQQLRRPVWVITPDGERLRADPFVAGLLRLPRVWVFGDEAALAELRRRR
jgi:DNA-binding transcriptional ArsR family regulator